MTTFRPLNTFERVFSEDRNSSPVLSNATKEWNSNQSKNRTQIQRYSTNVDIVPDLESKVQNIASIKIGNANSALWMRYNLRKTCGHVNIRSKTHNTARNTSNEVKVSICNTYPQFVAAFSSIRSEFVCSGEFSFLCLFRVIAHWKQKCIVWYIWNKPLDEHYLKKAEI